MTSPLYYIMFVAERLILLIRIGSKHPTGGAPGVSYLVFSIPLSRPWMLVNGFRLLRTCVIDSRVQHHFRRHLLHKAIQWILGEQRDPYSTYQNYITDTQTLSVIVGRTSFVEKLATTHIKIASIQDINAPEAILAVTTKQHGVAPSPIKPADASPTGVTAEPGRLRSPELNEIRELITKVEETERETSSMTIKARRDRMWRVQGKYRKSLYSMRQSEKSVSPQLARILKKYALEENQAPANTELEDFIHQVSDVVAIKPQIPTQLHGWILLLDVKTIYQIIDGLQYGQALSPIFQKNIVNEIKKQVIAVDEFVIKNDLNVASIDRD